MDAESATAQLMPAFGSISRQLPSSWPRIRKILRNLARPISACPSVLGPLPGALSRTKPPISHYLRESNKARHTQVDGDLAKPEGDVRWRPLLIRAPGARSLSC